MRGRRKEITKVSADRKEQPMRYHKKIRLTVAARVHKLIGMRPIEDGEYTSGLLAGLYMRGWDVFALPYRAFIFFEMSETMMLAWMREFSINHLWVSIPPQITPAR